MDEALHEEGDTAFTGDGIISMFAASSRVRRCANGRDVGRDLFWSGSRSSDLTSIASNVPGPCRFRFAYGRSGAPVFDSRGAKKASDGRDARAGCVERSGERCISSAGFLFSQRKIVH
jgi:hypothetical protein